MDIQMDLGQRPMNFTESQYGCTILDKLRLQKENGAFCDVVFHIKDQDVTFEAHRNVLAACSPYFDSMLPKSKTAREHITVTCKNQTVFDILLNYMYTGKVVIYKECVHELLKLANQFLISKLKDNCCEYLERNIDITNCLCIKDIAEECGLPNLAKTADHFITANIHHVIQQEEILEYPLNRLEVFIESKTWGLSQEMKLHLICLWIRLNPDERELHFENLLKLVEWKEINTDILHLHLSDNLLFQERDRCRYYILRKLHEYNLLYDAYVPVLEQLKSEFEQPEPNLNVSGNSILELAVSSAIGKLNNEHLETEPMFEGTSSDLNCSTERSCSSPLANGEQVPSDDLPHEKPVDDSINEEENVNGVLPLNNEDENNSDNPSKRKRKGTPVKIRISKEKIRKYLNTLPPKHAKKRGRPPKKKNLVESDKAAAKTKTKRPSLVTRRKLPHRQKKTRTPNSHLKKSESVDSNEESENETIDDHKIFEDYVADLPYMSDQDCEGDDEYSPTSNQKCDKKARVRRPSKERLEKISCPSCHFVANSASKLDHHMMSAHKDDTTYACNICCYETKWNREYYHHMKGHFSGPPYKCDHDSCDYSSERIQPLLFHRRSHTDERPFECTLCSFKFRTKNNLTTHLRCHTGEKPFKCQVCDRSFATKGTMEQHLVTHSDIRPYLCDTCGFSTKYQSHLISHKRIHTGDVYKCDFPNCTYSTPKRSQLQCHMRTHLSVRSHVCSVCGRAFVERSHLVRHERIHLEDKPFKCTLCEYSSTRRDKLKEHSMKHHGDSATSKAPYKPRKQRRQTYDPHCFPGLSPATAALASASGMFPLKMPITTTMSEMNSHTLDTSQVESQQLEYRSVGITTTIDPRVVGITLDPRHHAALIDGATVTASENATIIECKQNLQEVQAAVIEPVVVTATQRHPVGSPESEQHQQVATTTTTLQPVNPHLQIQQPEAQHHYGQPDFSGFSSFMSMF